MFLQSSIASHLQTDWLIGIDAQAVAAAFDKRVRERQELSQGGKLPVVAIAQSHPALFLADFFAAVALSCPVFLTNPHWQASEWRQVWAQVQPNGLWGTLPDGIARPASSNHHPLSSSCPSSPQPGWIMVPTGGSSGTIRFVIHTWDTLMASVKGFQDFFQAAPVNAYCVLPFYHVSGLMQVLRCFATGGTLAIAPFKTFERSACLPIEPSEFFLSLVPTQLQRLMRSPGHRRVLSQFQAVLLGGAPAWEELLEEGRSHGIPLAPTYGMTETASQVVTLTPKRFLQGHTSVGQVLPHARVRLMERNSFIDVDGFQERSTHSEVMQSCAPAGVNDAARDDGDASSCTNLGMGRIEIQGESLGLGYYPDQFFNGIFRPDDVGYWDDQGELHIVGRSSDKIISGGENIFPGEVEVAIRATGLVQDIAVLGMGDRHWGEIVTALYVPADDAVTPEHLKQRLSGHLSRYKHPKRWIPVEEIPRNVQGKINRVELREMAIAHWRHSSHQSSFQ